MKVSIVVPFHWMKNWKFFLNRCLESIEMQEYKDYEVILTKSGKMAENTNRAIQSAKGEIIKILFMDDYFAHKEALGNIVSHFKGGWLATACDHDNGEELMGVHYPEYNQYMKKGLNTIGSPSVIAFENKDPFLFDEKLSWILDCDLYVRLYHRYGEPTLLDDVNVIMGVGEHQTTNILTKEEKEKELNYLQEKYV